MIALFSKLCENLLEKLRKKVVFYVSIELEKWNGYVH